MVTAAVLDSRESAINEALARKGAGFGVKSTSIFKNNGVMRAGLSLNTGRAISPVFYPPEEWLEDASDDEVAERLIELDTNVDKDTQHLDISDILEPDFILSNVKPRLYGSNNKNDMDELDRVYTECLDWLIGYYVEIPQMSGEDGVSSIAVTNPMLNNNLTQDSIHTAALANISKEYNIRKMSDVISEFWGLPDFEQNIDVPDFLIVSNEKSVYGAAAILLQEVQNELTERLGDEFIVLPSSIHEILAVPSGLADDVTELSKMVTEINAGVVQAQDKLTDSVYLFRDGELHKIA